MMRFLLPLLSVVALALFGWYLVEKVDEDMRHLQDISITAECEKITALLEAEISFSPERDSSSISEEYLDRVSKLGGFFLYDPKLNEVVVGKRTEFGIEIKTLDIEIHVPKELFFFVLDQSGTICFSSYPEVKGKSITGFLLLEDAMASPFDAKYMGEKSRIYAAENAAYGFTTVVGMKTFVNSPAKKLVIVFTVLSGFFIFVVSWLLTKRLRDERKFIIEVLEQIRKDNVPVVNKRSLIGRKLERQLREFVLWSKERSELVKKAVEDLKKANEAISRLKRGSQDSNED